MSEQGQRLSALVAARQTSTPEDKCVLFERIIAEKEEELCHCKQENERTQRLLDSALRALRPRVFLIRADAQMSSLGPGLDLKQEIPETPQLKEEPEEQSITQEEDHLQVSVPESSDGCVKTEEFSVLQQKQTDHREDTQGEDISFETHVHPETDGDTEHSSDTDSAEEWSAPFSCSAAQMETEADGDHYNQVQTGARSTIASNSFLSPKYKSAPETRATMDKENMSLTAEGAARKKCSVYKETFGFKEHLKGHNSFHAGDKPYSCSVCEKAFTRKSHLTPHMRTHTGEKPYSCSLCEKAFTQKSHLTPHMTTHTGEKPYSCSVCEKAFTLNKNLTPHMRTHTGEKPYSCSVCKTRFTNRSNLKRHEKSHRREVGWTVNNRRF